MAAAAGAAFACAACAGVFDEDVLHGAGGGEEEVAAVLVGGGVLADELDEGFVDEGGGLEGSACGARGVAEFAGGEASEFGVEEGEEAVCGERVGW